MKASVKTIFTKLIGKQSARNATVLTTGLSLLSKVLGCARTWLLAYLFGATGVVDAYYIAAGAVSLIPLSLNSTMESALLPNMIQNDNATAKDLFAYAFRIFFIFSFVLILLMFLFPTQCIKLFAPTLDNERITYAADMVKWLLPYAFATVAIGLFRAWGDYQNRFAAVGTILASTNIFLIAALLILHPIMGDKAIAAFQSAAFIPLVIILRYVLRDIPLQPRQKLPQTLIRKASLDMLLCITASCAGFLYILVDRYFASSLPEGNISAISYAHLIFTQPLSLTAAAFSIYFVRANETVSSSKSENQRLFSTTLFMAWSYFLPAAALLSILARPVVAILLGHGAFDATAVALTSKCLAVIALGTPIFICNSIIHKHIIAIGKLKTLVAWNYIGILGNIILNALLVKRYGAPGLCAATVIMWHVTSLCLIFISGGEILLPLLKELLPQFIIVLLWAAPLYITMGNGTFIPLLAGIVIGLLHYLLCDRYGVYAKIPERWRPTAFLKLLASQAKLFSK